MKRLPLLANKVALNLLARDGPNAKAVWEATEGHFIPGVMMVEYPTLPAALAQIRHLQTVVPVVSVGLGGGDPAQWQKVVDTSLMSDPGHINQVFPAAAYTVGALRARNLDSRNVVNALISPSGTPGRVIISTGPASQRKEPAQVSCETAAAMLAEMGVESVQFSPIKGDSRLDEVREMARAAAEAGIPVFEPAGGITVQTVAKILQTCLEAGSQVVIPHIHTAIVDYATGLTKPDDAAVLLREVQRVVK